jgi:hypothetical protein
VALLLLVGAAATVMPSTPTLAGPPEPPIPQPEPFHIRLEQPLAGAGVAGEAVPAPPVRIAADPGTWYNLVPEENFDSSSSLPGGWSANAQSGPEWAIHDQQAVSPSQSAGVMASTGTLDTWLVYGGSTGFSMEDVVDAELTFNYWLDTEKDAVYFGWAASSDGQNFYGARISGRVGAWLTGALDMDQYIGDGSMWFAFLVMGEATTGQQNVYVDNVKVRAQEPYKAYFPAVVRNHQVSFTFTEDFSDRNSGWPHEVNWGSSESQQLNIRGYTNKLMDDHADGKGYIDSPCRQSDRYFMRIGNPNAPHVIAKAPVQAGARFTLEVDIAYCDSAHGASTGVVFGLNDAVTEYYRVILIYDAVDDTVKYAVWRKSATKNEILVSTSSSSHLKGGYHTNHVKVVREGCTISIYFNDHQVKTLTDECHYTDQRWVGLFHDRYSYYGYTGTTAFNFRLEEAMEPSSN